jgi:hypothetical protein
LSYPVCASGRGTTAGRWADADMKPREDMAERICDWVRQTPKQTFYLGLEAGRDRGISLMGTLGSTWQLEELNPAHTVAFFFCLPSEVTG